MIDLRCGDCLKILPTLRQVDAVVTDPPFGIAYAHGGGGKYGGESFQRCRRRNALMPIAGDNAPFDPSRWRAFPCLFWGANHFAQSLPKGGTWLAWDKSVGKGPADSFVDCEFAWCSTRGVKRNICRYLWKGALSVKIGEANGKRWHPMQKPIGLMRWSIERLNLPPGATILDPYMGSGSTGVAAVQLGYNFIGIDLHRPYVQIARRRIKAALAEAEACA